MSEHIKEDDEPVSVPKVKFLRKSKRKQTQVDVPKPSKESPNDLVKDKYPAAKRSRNFNIIDPVTSFLSDDNEVIVEPFNTEGKETENPAVQRERKPIKKKPKYVPPHLRPSTVRKPVSSKINEREMEWGPNINGYRFVRSSSDPVDEDAESNASSRYVRHTNRYSIDDLKSDQRSRFTGDSVLDDDFQARDRSFDPYGPSVTSKRKVDFDYKVEEDRYDVYLKRWDTWQEGDDLIWPSVDFKCDSVTSESLRRLFNTKKRLKRERIRWHPDKMGLRAKSDEMKLHIKGVFQIINTLWETTTND